MTTPRTAVVARSLGTPALAFPSLFPSLLLALLTSLLAGLLLAGCSSGGSDDTGPGAATSFTVGGTLSGLDGTVVLQNNGGDDLTLTVDGPFTFPTALADGAAFDVTVLTQPVDQICTIVGGTGAVSGADVTTITADVSPVVPPVGSYNAELGFFRDANANGLATEVRIQRQFYGRLVDIAWTTDLVGDAPITVVHRDFVVDPQVDSAWTGDYALRTHPVTGRQTLVIEADFEDTAGVNGQPSGRETFVSLLRDAEAGVRAVTDNGFVGAGTFTMVPRNAAFVVVFDDLLDPSTVNAQSIRLLVGEPTVIPFEARVFADSNHGGLANFDTTPGLEFYSTRMIIDAAVSEEEALESSLTPNGLGYPPSRDVALANVEVRMPSLSLNPTLDVLIQNPSGNALSSTPGENGTIDFGTAQREVVRAFRSGGLSDVTADPFNGRLPDDTTPSLVGSQAAALGNIAVVDPAQLIYEADLLFTNTFCAQPPVGGDIVAQGAYFAEVLPPVDPAITEYALQADSSALDVRLRLIQFPPGFADPADYLLLDGSTAEFMTPFNEGEDDGRAGCFLRVTPSPDYDGLGPIVSPHSTLSVRFNEAIDPDRFEPHESMALVRQEDALSPTPAEEASDYVPGELLPTVSLREFGFTPSVPLNTSQAGYSLDLGRGSLAPRDLAGNPAIAIPGPIPIRVLSTESQATGGRVIRFSAVDEEFPFADPNSPNGDPLELLPQREFNGQATYDLERGRLRGRPVVRQQALVSTSSITPAAMFQGPGTSLPLSPFGARTQILWRYADFVGLPLNEDNDVSKDLDLAGLNIDVEGVSLSPLGGSPVFESYPEFQMAMAHSNRAPDEVVTPFFGELIFPDSGLDGEFAANLLDPVNDPLREVHARADGYVINPGDQTVAVDGTPLLPLPMNAGVPAEQFESYTWRDTALMARGGPNGLGAPPLRVQQLTAVGPSLPFIDSMTGPICNLPGDPNPFYKTDEIRSAALPLLIDFRCYSTGGGASGNVFSHQLAHPSSLPGFRAFSSGGVNEAGGSIFVDPDQQGVANGGFDPAGTPPGTPVPGVDNVLYLGALDLVTRVSRVTSIFYPALDPIARDGDPNTYDRDTYPDPTYAEPSLFPASQPQGSRVELAFRGATIIQENDISTENAARSDYYGDFYLSRPVGFTPPFDGYIGGASCFDGSFDYRVQDENPGVGFLNGDNRWRDSISELDGARWIQVRISFISNPVSAEVPEVSSLGLAWSQE